MHCHQKAGQSTPRWPRNAAVTLTALLAVGLLTAGCSGNSSVSCDDYRNMSSSDRVSAVKALMSRHNDNDTPAKELMIRGSVSAYCFLHSGSSTIDGIYSAG
jgi:hypothetical protein